MSNLNHQHVDRSKSSWITRRNPSLAALGNSLQSAWTSLLIFTMGLASLASLALITPVATAQEVMKHPRVVELEDRLTRDASFYLKARFPDIPFIVTARVDPLRRENSGRSAAQGESLPYFEFFQDEEEFRDEWDNPSVPLSALLMRTRRISMQISVPSQVSEADLTELKEGLFNALHLTPARDSIDFNRRSWAVQEVPWIGIYIAGAAIFMLLVGLLIINRSSANRIARALTEMKAQSGNQNANQPALAPLALDSDPGLRPKSDSQEVKFNDPIKMKELATSSLKMLFDTKEFPNHHDVFVLDRLGSSAPQKLGALLVELPSENQTELLQYSTGHHWIKALNEPGFLDFQCLEVLQSLAQNPRGKHLSASHQLTKTILAVWRLGDDRTKLLRSISRDDAFALLSEMPKSIAVAEARRAFPGNWGAILDSKFKANLPSLARLKEIHDQAVAALPLNEISELKRYRSDKELLEYVRTADPSEEREIYEAADEGSLIHRMRPPFYILFQQSEELLKKIVQQVAVDRWSLALFNIPKTERQSIDRHMTEKQRFLLIERFKRFDQSPPPLEMIWKSREQIALTIKQLLAEQPESQNAQDSDAESEIKDVAA